DRYEETIRLFNESKYFFYKEKSYIKCNYFEKERFDCERCDCVTAIINYYLVYENR
ncbi:hypothetical protein B0H65DRAFT_436139, partial [Neurospora tetraspora]